MRNVADPADFLSAPERFYSNLTKVRQVVSYLVPSQAVVFVGSKRFGNMSLSQESPVPLPLPTSLSMVEPIYGTEYEVRTIMH